MKRNLFIHVSFNHSGQFVLSVMILALNLFGDGLRDALDPRLKNKGGKDGRQNFTGREGSAGIFLHSCWRSKSSKWNCRIS